MAKSRSNVTKGPWKDSTAPVEPEVTPEERIYRWMAWKSAKSLGERITAQVAKADKRGSRGTTVPLGDLRALLALIEPGMEPK